MEDFTPQRQSPWEKIRMLVRTGKFCDPVDDGATDANDDDDSNPYPADICKDRISEVLPKPTSTPSAFSVGNEIALLSIDSTENEYGMETAMAPSPVNSDTTDSLMTENEEQRDDDNDLEEEEDKSVKENESQIAKKSLKSPEKLNDTNLSDDVAREATEDEQTEREEDWSVEEENTQPIPCHDHVEKNTVAISDEISKTGLDISVGFIVAFIVAIFILSNFAAKLLIFAES